jgi:hypothetical protein
LSPDEGPALTADDWRTLDYRQRPRVIDEWARSKPERRKEDDPNEYVAKLGLRYDGCVIAMSRAHDFVMVPPPARAALAAFALLGQPFGFTHDDVAELRSAAERGAGASAGARPELLADLAARIERLLPPRGGADSARDGGR